MITDPAAPTSAAPAPVLPEQRLGSLDMLRGVALLTIFLANLFQFSGYDFLSPEEARALATWPLDRAAQIFRLIFLEHKGMSLFALMFGLGAGLQWRRCRQSGRGFALLHSRRLAALLLIGLAHAFLLWGGDILVPYALLGFVVLAMTRLGDRKLVVLATCIYFLPIPLYALGMVVGMPHPYEVAAGLTGDPNLYGRWMQGWGAGETWGAVIGANTAFAAYWWTMFGVTYFWSDVLGLFALGFLLTRRWSADELEDRLLRLPRRALLALVAAAVGGNAAFAWLAEQGVYHPPSALGLVLTLVQYVSVPALCLVYAAAVAHLVRYDAARDAVLPLVAVGRMSLTCYLSQSVIAAAIFYGVGLGLFGRLGAAPVIAVGVAVFAVQALACRWWLRRFRFGPAEWSWRALTYGTSLRARSVRPRPVGG